MNMHVPTPTALRYHREHSARLARFAEAAARMRPPVAIAAPEQSPAAVKYTISFVGPAIVIEGTVRKIQNMVCDAMRVERAGLLSGRRTRDLVMARQIGMFLSVKYTSASFPELGRRFGGRDHTTVLHAVRRVRAMVNSADGTCIGKWSVADCDKVRTHVANLSAVIEGKQE